LILFIFIVYINVKEGVIQMDNPEKLATKGPQDEENETKPQ